MMIRSLLLCCFCLAIPATEFVLQKQVEIDQALLCIADVLPAEQLGELPEAARALPLQRVTSTAGTSISAARVLQVLRQHQMWDANDSIRGKALVKRAQTSISAATQVAAVEADLKQRLEKQFQASKVNLTIERQPSVITILSDSTEAYELVLEPIDKTLIGRVPYRVRVMRGRFELGRQMVIMDVEIYYPTLAAVRDFKRGHVLGALDVIEKDARASSAREVATTQQLDDLVGKVLKQDLKAGQVIKDSYVRQAYAVKGGQVVDIVYQHEEFTITMRGRAHGNAALGQEVRVEAMSNGQLLRAKVIGQGQVAVH